jgi:hypothetical protein
VLGLILGSMRSAMGIVTGKNRMIRSTAVFATSKGCSCCVIILATL